MTTERQNEFYIFKLPKEEETVFLLKGKEAEEWKTKVGIFKELVSKNIEPDSNMHFGFKGKIIDSGFTFLLRCWPSLGGGKFRDSLGTFRDTRWFLPTFCLQQLEDMDEKNLQSHLRNAEVYIKEHFGKIKCAIFESCEEQ